MPDVGAEDLKGRVLTGLTTLGVVGEKTAAALIPHLTNERGANDEEFGVRSGGGEKKK